MTLIILLSMIFLVLPASTYSQQLTSQFGALELKANEDSNQPREYWLLFNGKEILQLEGYPVEILSVLHGTGRDLRYRNQILRRHCLSNRCRSRRTIQIGAACNI
jgi:hypothetical protein